MSGPTRRVLFGGAAALAATTATPTLPATPPGCSILEMACRIESLDWQWDNAKTAEEADRFQSHIVDLEQRILASMPTTVPEAAVIMMIAIAELLHGNEEEVCTAQFAARRATCFLVRDSGMDRRSFAWDRYLPVYVPPSFEGRAA